MKKMIFLLLILVLVGCGTVRSIFFNKNQANKEDFSVTNNIIHYKGKPLAELQAMTWSLDNGELVREMNFKLLDKEDLNVIGGMIDYLSDRHQNDEIEVEFDVPHNSDQFKL
jgi:uncharacterized protein YceK